MIVSLRRRVFWSILLSAAGVLLMILVAINVLKLAQTASKRDSILDSARILLRQDDGPERERDGYRRGERDKADLLRSVSEDELGAFLLAADGSVTARIGCAQQLEEETAAMITAAASASSAERGRAGEWMYKTAAEDGGVGILMEMGEMPSEKSASSSLMWRMRSRICPKWLSSACCIRTMNSSPPMRQT